MIDGLSKSSSISYQINSEAPHQLLKGVTMKLKVFLVQKTWRQYYWVWICIFADCAQSRGFIPRGGGWICIKLSCFGNSKQGGATQGGARGIQRGGWGAFNGGWGGIQRGHPFPCLHLSHTRPPLSDVWCLTPNIFEQTFLIKGTSLIQLTFSNSRKCKSCHQTIRSCPCYKYLQSSNHFSVARHDLPPEFDQGAELTSCETSSPPRSINDDDDGEKHAMPCHVPLHLGWSYLVYFFVVVKSWSDAVKIQVGKFSAQLSPPSASFFPFSCAASDPSMNSPQQQIAVYEIFREGMFIKHFEIFREEMFKIHLYNI